MVFIIMWLTTYNSQLEEKKTICAFDSHCDSVRLHSADKWNQLEVVPEIGLGGLGKMLLHPEIFMWREMCQALTHRHFKIATGVNIVKDSPQEVYNNHRSLFITCMLIQRALPVRKR